VCVSDYAAFKGKEENEPSDGSLLKGFLLLRSVVPALCNLNMSERVLPTVQALSEVAKKREWRGGGVNCDTPRNKNTTAQDHNEGDERRGGAADSECRGGGW